MATVVLHRPAWLDGPNLKNAELYSFVAKLIRENGPERAPEQLQRSKLYADIRARICRLRQFAFTAMC